MHKEQEEGQQIEPTIEKPQGQEEIQVVLHNTFGAVQDKHLSGRSTHVAHLAGSQGSQTLFLAKVPAGQAIASIQEVPLKNFVPEQEVQIVGPVEQVLQGETHRGQEGGV